MTLTRRLERLEARKPIPRLVDVLGAGAEFFMRCFERVCVECEDRAKYPHCPREDCETLFQAREAEAKTLDANDPRERAMLEGVGTWRARRMARSDWLKGGFSLFAYEDEAYNELIRTAHEGR